MLSSSSPIIAAILLLGSLEQVFSSNSINNACSTIFLIHVYPSSGNEELSEWNETEVDLLRRAGHLAAAYINNRTDLLPGLKLEIVDVSTDDCIRDAPLQDLVEVFQKIYEKKCVFGVVGLYCSRVTQVFSIHLSHPHFGYVQLSSSTSPVLRNNKRYPHLFRVISSSVTFNKVVIKMMDDFSWKNISLIYDFSDIYFRSTGFDFAMQMQDRRDLNLLAFFPIRSSGRHSILEDIVKKESRVAYFSITHNESSDVLCDAYFHKFFWPEFVYIFIDTSLEEILADNKKCTRDQLLRAAEGIILLRNKLSNSDNFTRSEIQYEQYNKELILEYKNNSKIFGGMQYYANVLYDQIWAFAFAINKSIGKIKTNMNGSLKDMIELSPFIRNILVPEFKNISFQGASGKIRFNEEQEVLTMIDIFQVKNGKQISIGDYNPYEETLILDSNFDRETVPEDSFEIRHDAIPVWLGVLVALLQGLLLLLFTITCVYLVHWRDAPEIKSTSLRISVFIMTGCFMVIFSSLFYNLENFSNASATAITVFCNIESWLFLYGINVILVALMFRLLRVSIIFHYPHTKVKLLSDRHLITYISITSLLPLLLLVIWTAVDPLAQVPVKKFVLSGNDPHYTELFYCSSSYTDVWTTMYYSWIGVLLVILLVLAVLTRHVKYNDFKDTKKMGAFIFSVSFMLGTLLPVWYLLESNAAVVSYIVKSMLSFLIPLACLALQYFPKVFPVLHQRKLSKMSSTLSFKNLRIIQRSEKSKLTVY